MVLFGDPEEHAKHLSRVYLDRDAGKMNDFQKGQVNFFTKQIGRMSKTLTDLETKEASLPGVDYSLQKEELQLDLSNAYSQIEKILNISSQGDSNVDAYGGNAVNPYSRVDAKIEEFKKNPAEVLARTFNTQNVNEDDYNILFADDNEIGENVLAQIQANQNATDDSEVAIDGDFPDDSSAYRPAIVPENLSQEDREELDVPALLSGLGMAQAKTPSRNREPKDFDVPKNLRDARNGSEFLKDKIKKLRRDIKTSETAPNLQTRENFKKELPKQIKELKELFSSIYDESTDTFYDDNSEAIRRRRERFPVLKDKPLSYRELLGDDFIKFINSL